MLFQVMRYVEGEDLRAMLRREGRLEPERAAPIIAAVAAALDAAHARGLVHRDVKPANVLLDAGRHVYLTDFGLSVRLGGIDDSRPGRLLGTVHYISPEQIRGEEIGVRTDVYALGAMLFHMLTGGVPFPADTDEARLWAHLSEPPPAPSRAGGGIPAAFDSVIARAMAKDPAHRYASAGELSRAALAAVGEPPAPPPAAPADDRRALATRALADPFSLAAAGAIVLAGRDLRRPRPGPAAGARRLPRGRRARLPRRRRARGRARAGRAGARASAGRAGWRRRSSCSSGRRRRPGSASTTRSRSPTCPTPRSPPRSTGSWRPCTTPPRAPSGCTRGCATPRRTRSRRGSSGSRRKTTRPRPTLATALGDQLAVQRRMEAQLGHFYAEMDRMLIELDTVRGNLVSVSASSGRDNQAQVAGEVRELRDDMGAVAAGIDQGSITVAKVPR